MVRLVTLGLLTAAALPAPLAGAQVPVGADLRASARATPASAEVGDDVTVVAGVENAGPEQATEVILTVTLPHGLFVQAVESDGHPCAQEGVVTCRMGALPAGASAGVRILAGVTRGGSLPTGVHVDAQQDDPVPANDEAGTEVSGKGRDCDRVGTAELDRFRAPGDGAVLCGLGGDDVLLGGLRADELLGGAGDDSLVGDGGRDRLDGGEGTDGCAGGPREETTRRCEHAVFALARRLPLADLGPDTIGYGYHQSLFRTAIGMRPLEPHVVMDSRGRGTGSTTAADIVVGSRAPVRSPVTGRVVAVTRYLLYCASPDWKVVIKPRSDPDLRVLVLHMARPVVRDGEEVRAGVSLLGRAQQNDGASSQANAYFPDQYPHVHVEVERDRASPTPGCSI